MPLAAPQPLADHHQLEPFACGVAALDDWLKRRARANQVGGASRTYVLSEDDAVIGYYALASGAVAVTETFGRFRRNMPDPIPVAILARLAIDQARHGQGLGRALFRDAALRILQAGDIIGMRGMVVHAVSEEARSFYLALGLEPSPSDPMMLMVSMTELRQALARDEGMAGPS